MLSCPCLTVSVGGKFDFRARKVQIIMPEMVSTILVDFRVTSLPSEAHIMEKIVRYQQLNRDTNDTHRYRMSKFLTPQAS